MNRTLLAVCLSLGAGLAFAAQPAGAPYAPHPVCPKAAEKTHAVAEDDDDADAPVAAAPAAPAAHPTSGGGGSNSRLLSPRWHTLLPGMFR